MNVKDGDEPAFPVESRVTEFEVNTTFGHQSGSSVFQFPGMTLRDYFAAKAMQGDIFDQGLEGRESLKHIANMSYEMADAMMEARMK